MSCIVFSMFLSIPVSTYGVTVIGLDISHWTGNEYSFIHLTLPFTFTCYSYKNLFVIVQNRKDQGNATPAEVITMATLLL